MLVAAAYRALGDAAVRSVSVLEREFRGYVTCRRHLAFDTRLSARASGRAEPCGHLYLVMDGRLATSTGVSATGPVAFVLADTELERVDPRTSITFRTDGPRVAIVQLSFPAEHLRVPVGLAHGPLPIDARVIEAARRLIADCEADTVGPASFPALLDGLGAAGTIAPGLAATIVRTEPERFERLWRAIEPLYAGFATSASFKEIADRLDMSLRQLARDAKEAARTFRVPAQGYRDLSHLLRVRAAVMLLSAPVASITDVATLVGYGSTIAMGRAFRDAGLPTPGEVRQALARPERSS